MLYEAIPVYRFAKGNANYMLAPERYSDFYEDYGRNGRSIQEHVITSYSIHYTKLYDGKILKGDMSQYGFGIQAKTQGGAFDTDGHLWLTQSDSKFGRLQKIDRNNFV